MTGKDIHCHDNDLRNNIRFEQLNCHIFLIFLSCASTTTHLVSFHILRREIGRVTFSWGFYFQLTLQTTPLWALWLRS